jgi:hypothetical protein
MALVQHSGHSISITQDGAVKAKATLLSDVDGANLRLPGGRGWVKVTGIVGARGRAAKGRY